MWSGCVCSCSKHVFGGFAAHTTRVVSSVCATLSRFFFAFRLTFVRMTTLTYKFNRLLWKINVGKHEVCNSGRTRSLAFCCEWSCLQGAYWTCSQIAAVVCFCSWSCLNVKNSVFLFTHFVKRFLVVLVHRKNMFSSERSDTLKIVQGQVRRRRIK